VGRRTLRVESAERPPQDARATSLPPRRGAASRAGPRPRVRNGPLLCGSGGLRYSGRRGGRRSGDAARRGSPSVGDLCRDPRGDAPLRVGQLRSRELGLRLPLVRARVALRGAGPRAPSWCASSHLQQRFLRRDARAGRRQEMVLLGLPEEVSRPAPQGGLSARPGPSDIRDGAERLRRRVDSADIGGADPVPHHPEQHHRRRRVGARDPRRCRFLSSRGPRSTLSVRLHLAGAFPLWGVVYFLRHAGAVEGRPW
jgi:hypothetical protein